MSFINAYLAHLGRNSGVSSIQDLNDLLSADEHPAYMRRHRAELLLERIRFLASVFAVLVPLWLVVDYWLLPADQFWPILVIRLVSTLHFIYLARYTAKQARLNSSLFVLAGLLLNLPLTFFAATQILSSAGSESLLPVVQLYSLLPYIALGLLGLFPLSLMECAALALPLTLIPMTSLSFLSTLPFANLFPTLWLLMLIFSMVLFASSLQLQHMIALVTRPDYDPITGAQTRKSGNISLAKALQQAKLHNEHLSVALIDLDNTQAMISQYDYETYSHVIQEAAEILVAELRRNDMLVHWSEKVFMLILPGTDCEGGRIIAQRIHDEGLGNLPDGRPVTASIGLCERASDTLDDLPNLIALIEGRRNEAKSRGRDCFIPC
ncbi:MAG: GGDEF domain-containing protein [Candidatus Thiodiazotropha sp.]